MTTSKCYKFSLIRTTPEVAYERILARHRNEEVKIPFEYIRQLHELHEQWLISRTKFEVSGRAKDFLLKYR